MKEKKVPLVIYDDDGNRKEIGEAIVDADQDGLVVSATIEPEAAEKLKLQGGGVTLSGYSIGWKKDKPEPLVVEKCNCQLCKSRRLLHGS